MSSEELRTKGNEAFKAKDYETAINLYTEAIKVDENNHLLYSNRAACYIELKKYEEAIEDSSIYELFIKMQIEKTVELKPDFVKGYHRWGFSLRSLEKYGEALHIYNNGVEKTEDAFLKKQAKEIREIIKEKDDQLPITSVQDFLERFRIQNTFIRMATLVLLWNHSKRTERMLLIEKFLNNVLSEREAKEILVKYDKSDLTKLPNTNYASVVLPKAWINFYLPLSQQEKVNLMNEFWNICNEKERLLIQEDIRHFFLNKTN